MLKSIVDLAQIYEDKVNELTEENLELKEKVDELSHDLISLQNDLNFRSGTIDNIRDLWDDGFFCKNCEHKDVRGSGWCDGCELLVEIRDVLGYF